jgi:hypothetical protein
MRIHREDAETRRREMLWGVESEEGVTHLLGSCPLSLVLVGEG